MRLDEYLSVVRGSEPRDWVSYESPTYLEDVSERLIYAPDIRMGLAWGHTVNENYHGPETWVENFPDSSASSHNLDFFFNGMLVHRETGVYIDGYRCIVPLPEIEEDGQGGYRWWITAQDYDFWRLMNAVILPTTDYDSYVRRAGFDLR
jgi:hypothetical protein